MASLESKPKNKWMTKKKQKQKNNEKQHNCAQYIEDKIPTHLFKLNLNKINIENFEQHSIIQKKFSLCMLG